MAKKKRKKSAPPEDSPRTSESPAPETTSLPPTKKSNLPPELAHDNRDIDARGILKFSGAVLAITLVSMGGMWLLDQDLQKEERAHHTPPPPMASALPSVPVSPKLQRAPRAALETLRAEEQATLDNYAWVDRDKGIVQIPIERAMQLIAERDAVKSRRLGPPPERSVSHPTDGSLGAVPIGAAPPGGTP